MQEPAVLFTAFEPSGDELGAAVIRELLRRRPGLVVWAWGGPKMQDAGARLVERTTDEAEMGLPGLAKVREHLAIHGRVKEWLARHGVTLHVPVDSPAANFPICKLTRARECAIVHLAAPQMWAWAGWRIRKMRRLTDLALCLLPFEEPWFRSRGVAARFIGHPMFERMVDEGALRATTGSFPAPSGGGARVALLPGSRPKEWRQNFPVLLRVMRRMQKERPGTVGVVAASSESAERALRDIAAAEGGWPDGVVMAREAVDAAARWADLCLSVSGTVSLQLARARAPMVLLYRIAGWQHWLVGRWIIRSHSATLPNLIAGRRIVPEFVPFAGRGSAFEAAALRLLADEAERERQRRDLASMVCARFEGKRASEEAADEIERALGRASS